MKNLFNDPVGWTKSRVGTKIRFYINLCMFTFMMIVAILVQINSYMVTKGFVSGIVAEIKPSGVYEKLTDIFFQAKINSSFCILGMVFLLWFFLICWTIALRKCWLEIEKHKG